MRPAAKESGAPLKGRSNVKVAAESTFKHTNPDGTVRVVREQAANPGANKHLFHGKLKDEPIPGINKPNDGLTRNTNFLNADGDVLSFHLTIENVIALFGQDALKKGVIFQTVLGRGVCNECLKDIPKLAAHYVIPAVVENDDVRKVFLFWRKDMIKSLVPFGRCLPAIDIAAIASKGLALGAPRLYNQYQEE